MFKEHSALLPYQGVCTTTNFAVTIFDSHKDKLTMDSRFWICIPLKCLAVQVQHLSINWQHSWEHYLFGSNLVYHMIHQENPGRCSCVTMSLLEGKQSFCNTGRQMSVQTPGKSKLQLSDGHHWWLGAKRKVVLAKCKNNSSLNWISCEARLTSEQSRSIGSPWWDRPQSSTVLRFPHLSIDDHWSSIIDDHWLVESCWLIIDLIESMMSYLLNLVHWSRLIIDQWCLPDWSITFSGISTMRPFSMAASQ